MAQNLLLDGKSVVITGAGSGVGRASALLFARHGARVVCADVQEGWAQATAAMIEGPGRGVAQACDVRSEAAVVALVKRAVDEFGRLDVMYNNAGVWANAEGRSVTLLDQGDEDFSRLVEVNFHGMVYGCQAAVRQFLKQGGGGVIVNTGSVGGIVGWGGVLYGATKAAGNQLTRALAIEVAKHGIRANAVCPGAMITNFGKPVEETPFDNPPEDLVAMYSALHPLGQPVTAEDAANAALFLASDMSSNITGVLLPVDGGFIAA